MYCVSLESTISCELCLKRQKLAREIGPEKIKLDGPISLLKCHCCDQGKPILLNEGRYIDRDYKELKKEVFTKRIIELVKSGKKPKRIKLKRS